MVMGKRMSGRPRATKQFDTGRVCSDDSCEQVLSIYNDNKQCFKHAPMKIPRTRGRINPLNELSDSI